MTASETITLSVPGKATAVRACVGTWVLTCKAVSAPGVYVGGITATGTVHNLTAGDSLIAKDATLTVTVHSLHAQDDVFSATCELEQRPAAPSPPSHDATILEQFTAPRGAIEPSGGNAPTGGVRDR